MSRYCSPIKLRVCWWRIADPSRWFRHAMTVCYQLYQSPKICDWLLFLLYAINQGESLWCPRGDSNSHASRHEFLRLAWLPLHHRGSLWWLWLVSIQPPRLMRAVRIHLRHTTERLGCLMGIEPTHIGITIRGLTTWRQTPYRNTLSTTDPRFTQTMCFYMVRPEGTAPS